ncbi:transcriptional regulator [Temperatibacter marinus]|uniref:Transcriptional regulator n=1 Tax=Temperatibacter marinus TaxID=1456591 RepID=A0AA52HAS2_9PROT|nr:transcriptional regulator [Temperatibacter marinus]WND02903.1 transcriptional regulator [Temperatibacter marinus]
MSTPELQINKINEIIHGRIRLGIMVYLANADTASFVELKTSLEVTQGNLSVNIRKLEEASYIKVEKSFAGRKPLTTCRITHMGREALSIYLDTLKSVLSNVE